MNTKLTINQLGKAVGLSTKAIRYYEDIGLISSAERAENGYRVYDNSFVEDLKHIKYARDLGLPIQEIKKLMKGCEDRDCNHTKTYVKEEIETYVTLLAEKIRNMQILQKKLSALKTNIEKAKKDDCNYCCNVLQQLPNVSEGGEK